MNITKVGAYLARSVYRTRYIVFIVGDPPFLKVNCVITMDGYHGGSIVLMYGGERIELEIESKL